MGRIATEPAVYVLGVSDVSSTPSTKYLILYVLPIHLAKKQRSPVAVVGTTVTAVPSRL